MKHFISSLSVINANTPPCEGRVSSRKILSLLLILFLSIGNVWAEEVTFSGDDIRASFNYGNNYKEGTFTSDGFSIYCSSGYGNTAAQFRVAKSATLTISSTVGNITKVVITVTGTSYKLNDNNISWSSTTGTYSNAGGVQEITFTNSSANIARISEIAITYEPSSAGGGENSGEGEESETPGSQSTATLIVGENGGVTWTNGAKTANATVGDVVFTALGSGSNDSKYYDSDKSWRFYTANTSGVKITIPEGSKIVSVIIKWKTGQPNTPTNWSKSGTSSPTTFTPNSGINTNEVSFTRNSSANFLAQEITVNYETSSSGSGSEEPVPSVTLDPSSKDFGTVNVGENLSQEFTITTENTTATLSAEISNTTDYVISDIADNKITVTYQPQTAGTHEATLTIKAGEEASTTVALTGKAKTPLEPIAGGVIDILNQAWTGKTNSTYGDVAEKTAENTGHSNAKYVAQCAGDKSSIQLRSNNSNSGVVSTISGGVVKRIEVEWHADTDAARTLQIYGSNTAYTAATDLYGAAAGELLGELNKGEGETTLDFSEWTGDYKYIGFRSKSGAMYLTTVTITWLPTISKVTIDDQIENGSVSVSGAADLNSVAAGTELTLSHTPTTGYKLSAYDVYKTGDNTTKVTIDGNTFVMPEFDVTISATFELAKTLTGLDITTPATQTTFWQGETFNYEGLKVTAHFDGAADEDVTDEVTVTGSTATADNQTVTVSYNEGATTKTATYNITVKAIPNTKETAYSVAEAYDIIDKLTTAEGVFISGIISQVDSYNETYKSITYWISADGTTTKQLQVYSGKGLESADFSGKTDLSVGDQVIVCGNLKKYSGTYEFDKNNYLASHTPTTKDPAGLAYATTSYTANVGEAFTTPELTNPHNLVVTYSTSDASKATVDANTGAVTIEAAGVVTITAATTGDASHDAGSASYTITISNPAMAVATLPFTFNSGKADIENTAGMTQNGLGSDYSSAPNSQLKFDHTGDWIVIRFDSEPGEFSFLLKQNGSSAGTFTVYESANGEDYTSVWAGGDFGNAQSETIKPTLSESARYVKFEYTTKPSGTNYGLGQISIKKIDKRQEAGLAWNPTSVTLTQGEAFTAPTLNNPYSVLGITYESSNEEVATVTAEGEIALASAIGTATITATFADGDATYKPATATCTITVNEYIETIDGEWELVTDASKLQAGMEIIIASVADAGTVKTMGEQGNNNRSAVASTVDGDKLNPAVGTTVITLEDCQLYEGLFALKTKDGYLYAASSSSNHLKSQEGINNNACWTITITEGVAAVVATNSSNRNIMRYNETSDLFSCYASGQQGIALYKKVPDYTRDVRQGYYGTICLPNGGTMVGASIFEIAYKDASKIYFDEILSNEMVAGIPYIFLPNEGVAELEVYYTNEANASAGSKNGLVGSYTQKPLEVNGNNYILLNNQYCEVIGEAYVGANRAYFQLSGIPTSAPAPAPGVRRVSMGMAGQSTATGVDQVQGDELPTKMIINGQLFILRGEKMYDAQGKLVK